MKTDWPRVLIVDDDANIPRALRRLLSLHELRGVEAHDAATALALLREQDVDVLITDVRLAGTSGILLVEEARRIDAHLPVVIMSGAPLSGRSSSAHPTGDKTLFMQKPGDRIVLVQWIRDALARRPPRPRRPA